MNFIYSLYILSIWGYITNSKSDQLPVRLIAQLVRTLERYRRGHGFESRSNLFFFSGFIFSTALVGYITAMILVDYLTATIYHLHFKCYSAIQIYEFHIFTLYSLLY